MRGGGDIPMSYLENRHSDLLRKISELQDKLNFNQPLGSERSNSLIKSEELYALAMRDGEDGLWDWNLKTNEVYYSDSWKRMLGYADSELPQTIDTWADLVHIEDKYKVLNTVYEYLSGNTPSFEVELRMRHKNGHYIFIRSRAYKTQKTSPIETVHLIGTHIDISHQKQYEIFDRNYKRILEMIAMGKPSSNIYEEIASLYEARNPGMRCSLVELSDGRLNHCAAPSLPTDYCKVIDGLEIGSDIGSCGTAIFTKERVIVQDIKTDKKWTHLRSSALPHGLRSCWSEPIFDSSGEVLGAFGMYYDHPALPTEEELNDLTSASRLAGIVLERERNLKKIRELAYSDKLTGLANRTCFFLEAKKRLSNASRSSKKLSILYIDLDNFKSINDTLGHDAGDALLIECARRLKVPCREIDFVARLSGDEFCIIVQDINDEYSPGKVAQRCIESVSTLLELKGVKITPSCSIGISHYPEDGKDIKDLLAKSDTALYEAKSQGRGRYAYFDKNLTQKVEHRIKLENLLKDSIERNKLSLVYQPIIDIKSRKVVSVEALARWNHPELGQVPPIEFIRTAERIGMINKLSEWILYTSCRQASLWNRSDMAPISVTVNILKSHLLSEGFVALISKIISDTDLPPYLLELEITEKGLQDTPELASIFKELSSIGVKIAIDDFGTGGLSFSSLIDLKVDTIKIDKLFIDKITSDRKSFNLVRSMVDIVHTLGHKVVAEGVEIKGQIDLLEEMKCETAQGFVLGKPISASEAHFTLNKTSYEA